MIRIGDQFVGTILGRNATLVAIGFTPDSDKMEFAVFLDGVMDPSSFSMTAEEVESGGGHFNIRPIDSSDPSWVVDWKSHPMYDFLLFYAAMNGLGDHFDPMDVNRVLRDAKGAFEGFLEQ